MSTLDSNSFKSKSAAGIPTPAGKIAPVAQGVKITDRDKGIFEKLLESVFVADKEQVKDFIVYDVLIPGAKKAISDTVNIILYGSGVKANGINGIYKTFGTGGIINYSNILKATNEQTRAARLPRVGYADYSPIAVESAAKATEVLHGMCDILETYGKVRVAEMYELADISTMSTDSNYGWESLAGADVYPLPDGRWTIRLPKCTLIN